MKSIDLDYGTRKMTVDLPDSSVVVRYGETYLDPPPVDPVAATRAALSMHLSECRPLLSWPAPARQR